MCIVALRGQYDGPIVYEIERLETCFNSVRLPCLWSHLWFPKLELVSLFSVLKVLCLYLPLALILLCPIISPLHVYLSYDVSTLKAEKIHYSFFFLKPISIICQMTLMTELLKATLQSIYYSATYKSKEIFD